MSKEYFIGTLSCIALLAFMVIPSFSQSAAECTITSKSSNLIIISCPDGNRTIDAGGRVDLYRVGDRVDVYGMPGNRPSARPGETPLLGR